MQLLTHHIPAAYDEWKREFDAETETRMNAGLTLLQLWQDVDDSGVTALYKVNDRKKAEDWLKRERQTSGPLESRFLRTA
ncbi:hypothetical protein JSE7799_03211 [Jannaschia seosinensis]|uniref:Uncharacterized protein n=1 Tax=Jannaschia seosinensis TaxID=313367 RepID=A0A0M7BEH1_9RHOB|nr:DUF3303 family protein [Jannaschia seosinensis]CUH40478.1 hypothetical protein JSE7799_03211 [Jannaschia seosinensis]